MRYGPGVLAVGVALTAQQLLPVHVVALLEANDQASHAIQPGDGPFHDPAVPTEAGRGLDPRARDAALNAALPQQALVLPRPVAIVRLQLVRSPAPPSHATADWWNGVEELDQDRRFVGVRRRGQLGERNALPVGDQMPLGVRLRPIRRIRAGLAPPFFAGTVAASIAARDQSSRSASRSRFSNSCWRAGQTPAAVQSRERSSMHWLLRENAAALSDRVEPAAMLGWPPHPLGITSTRRTQMRHSGQLKRDILWGASFGAGVALLVLAPGIIGTAAVLLFGQTGFEPLTLSFCVSWLSVGTAAGSAVGVCRPWLARRAAAVMLGAILGAGIFLFAPILMGPDRDHQFDWAALLVSAYGALLGALFGWVRWKRDRAASRAPHRRRD